MKNSLGQIVPNTSCKIREIKPKDTNNVPQETNKIVLHLGSLFHRTHIATGDFYKIANEQGASFVTVDWPTVGFDEEKVLKEITDYIRANKGKEFIISGLSFGEIIARDLFTRLTDEEKKQIKLYISICGVSDFEKLQLPKHIDLIKKINTRVLRILGSMIGRIDRGALGKKLKGVASSQMADKSEQVIETVGKPRVNRLVKAASIGINAGMFERFQLMLQQEGLFKSVQWGIETVILYSKGDPTFINPQQNARALARIHNNSRIICLENAGHAALVEKPQIYNPLLKDLLFSKWGEIG